MRSFKQTLLANSRRVISGCCSFLLLMLFCGTVTAQTTTFNFTGAPDVYVVPAGVTSVIISANGAQGGATPTSSPAGLGAIMTGTFAVTPGSSLNILVGEQGDDGSDSDGGAGGGGSFVADAANNPLIVAGGGGGTTAGIVPTADINANTTTNGNNGSPTGNDPLAFGVGGVGGNGGTNSPTGAPAAGNGGGFFTDGEAPHFGNSGQAYLNGGAGGLSIVILGVDGGFGGGGSACNSGAGGGGGYSGGGGSWDNPTFGGGGGSFNGGMAQNNSVGNAGNGQVTITVTLVNDLCADALPITCGGTVTGNTDFASASDAPADCIPSSNSSGGIWYTWIGDGSNATFSTCGAGTNFDTQIAVTSGGCAVAPVCVGGNDDYGLCAGNGSYATSTFSFLSTVGTTYHVYVTGFVFLTGTFDLSLTCCAPLVAVCSNATVVLSAANPGAGVLTAAMVNGGSTSGCGGLITAITAGQIAYSCADVGAGNQQIVTLTATDGFGNTSTCNATVTTEDQTNPTVTCNAVTVQLDPNGIGTLTAAAVVNTAVDNCSTPAQLAATGQLTQSAFNCGELGANTVTLTVTDANGNESTCTAVVTVVDPIPAIILCRPNVNTVNDPDLCGADVLLLPPLVIEENCSITTVARVPAAGVIFPTGTTLVTWTLTDAGGNNTSCLQNVTIHDTEDPIVDCGNSFIAYTSWDNCGYPSYLLEGATATDNCPGVVITDDAPNFFPPGQYMVNYTATDAAGNTAVCMQWVKIYDTTKPQLVSCPDDIEVEATTADGANASWSLPTGIDNCPGPIILVEENGYAPGDFFNLGETAISYRLYDQNGQFVECEFTVTVSPIGALALDLICMPDLDISLSNVINMGYLGWNPPLMNTNCEQCDVLASDDFQVIGTLAGHQYYTHTAAEMTFAEAIAYAENIGATIAILEDKKEVPMIENELPAGNYFIGLIDAEGTGEFAWINDDEFVVADFGTLLENETEEPAVVILNEDGEWEVVALADATANFVFEKVCVDWSMDTAIDEEPQLGGSNDENLVEAGSTAEITYTAVDPCGNVSTCGFEVVFVADAVAYCEPAGIATDEENPYFIESFSLNGYTVETGDDEGYGDHTDEHFLFTPGEVLEMHTSFAGPNIDELPMYCRIWIDLNNDGDFYDEGELIMQGVDVEEAIAELTIPNVNQSVENTVMRIAISRLTYAESCGDFLNGEVEDYTIIFDHETAQFMQVNLQGNREGFATTLRWVTQTNLDINTYDIERSMDGVNFEKIKTNVVDATTKGTPAMYHAKDNSPELGFNFYRLEVFPANGAPFYTNIVSTKFNDEAQRLTVYPNPADEYAMLHLEGAEGKTAILQLFNVLGQQMQTMSIDELTDEDIRIDLDNLVDGNYYLHLTIDGQRTAVQKLIVDKLNGYRPADK
jgi:hypothetical protein